MKSWNIIRSMVRLFSFIALIITTTILSWVLRSKNKNIGRSTLSLRDFNGATQIQKSYLFKQWCEAKGISGRTCSLEELESYAAEFELPTFSDWKEIHGYSREAWLLREDYVDWLRFLGAYNPKMDPDCIASEK